MTAPVSGATGPGYVTNNASSSADRPDQMGSDMFLKLLVAEMKYQDPSSPMSTSDMMAQTATLTQTQSLQQIQQQNAQLVSLQRSLAAVGLVGHTVSYTATDGSTQAGKVSSVALDPDTNTTTAVVDGKPVDVGRITQVGPIA
jgi:flagellar basal-body rod modification protein FlgD